MTVPKKETFLELLSLVHNINRECEPGTREGEVCTTMALHAVDIIYDTLIEGVVPRTMSTNLKTKEYAKKEIRRAILDGVLTVIQLLAETALAKEGAEEYAQMEIDRCLSGDREADASMLLLNNEGLPDESASEKIATAVAAERERCARVAEDGSFLHADAPDAKLGKALAARIRSGR